MGMDFEPWLQSRLTAHGFPVGGIDGVIGPTTIAALKAFEKKHGLTIDGTADPIVVQALRAPASAVTPAEMVRIPNRDADTNRVFVPETAMVWPRQKDCMSFYGPVGTSQTSIEIPFDMYLAWDPSTKIKKMTLHKKVAASALETFEEIAGIYSLKEIRDLGLHLFGGSLNVRKMRGGNSYSMHSWGIAIDFDPIRNQLSWNKPKARLSHDDAIPFWKAWEKRGWLSLGRARNFDWMHIQAARL